MSTDKKNTETTEKGSGWGKIAAACIVLLLAAAITVICIFSPSWFGKGDGGNSDSTDAQIMAISDEGEKLYAGGAYTMPKAMTIVADVTSGADSISGGEFTITPALDNEYINGIFDFECYFPENSPEWANDKQASDYISLTPETTSSAKIRLNAAFSAPIEIKVTLVGSSASATCRVDYLRRPTVGPTNMMSTDMEDSAVIAFSLASMGVGTVTGEFDCIGITADLTSAFISKTKSYLNFDITIKSAIITKDKDSIRIEYREGGAPSYIKLEDGFNYSMFIEGFDSYSAKHKDAIYYAWYMAYTSLNDSNVFIDYSFTYTYKNIQLNFTNTEKLNSIGRLTGYKYGSAVNPDIDLNGGIVF